MGGTCFPEEVEDQMNSTEEISTTSTEFVDRQRSHAIQRKRAFFQRNGSYLYQNFFELLRNTKKTGVFQFFDPVIVLLLLELLIHCEIITFDVFCLILIFRLKV